MIAEHADDTGEAEFREMFFSEYISCFRMIAIIAFHHKIHEDGSDQKSEKSKAENRDAGRGDFACYESTRPDESCDDHVDI